jgi:integrase
MTMLKRTLTDKAIAALKPAPSGKRPITWDGVVNGFGVRVTDKGHRTFVLVARYPGERNPAIRAIGDVGSISLASARDVARSWREDIAKGVDPRDKAEAARRAATAAKANTFQAAFEDFAREHLSQLRTGAVVAGVIKKHVLPVLGDRPLGEITRADGNDLLRRISKTTPTHANRIASYLSKFGQWLEDDERVAESPFMRLRRFSKVVSRDRILSDDEVRAVWQATEGMGQLGRAVRFMLATGQRRGEVGNMTWAEVDLAKALWTLPRGRVKSDRTHEVPLSPLALSILDEARKVRTSDSVFTTSRSGGSWNKFKLRLDRAAAVAEEWHLHDLRRTAATQMAGLGVERLTISKILNHAEAGVTQVYDRHRYDAEKRAALDRWSTRLEQIVGLRQAPDNVIHLAMT